MFWIKWFNFIFPFSQKQKIDDIYSRNFIIPKLSFISIQKPSIAVQETPNYDFNPHHQGYEQAVESDDEHEDEAYDEDEFEQHYTKSKGIEMRSSVSAEAYGKFH